MIPITKVMQIMTIRLTKKWMMMTLLLSSQADITPTRSEFENIPIVLMMLRIVLKWPIGQRHSPQSYQCWRSSQDQACASG